MTIKCNFLLSSAGEQLHGYQARCWRRKDDTGRRGLSGVERRGDMRYTMEEGGVTDNE